MTTEAKVGAFVLSCFAVLAFTVIFLLNAQYSGGTVRYPMIRTTDFRGSARS